MRILLAEDEPDTRTERPMRHLLASAAILSLCLSLTGAGGAALAQEPTGALRVRVRHAAAPIPGARVSSEGVVAGTDLRGDARLRLPVGEHRVAIARLGFADTTVVATVPAGSEATLTVELREKTLEAEALVVTATRGATVVEEQPIRVEAVPLEEIEENQTIAPGSLTTLLNELPGVHVDQSVPGLGGAGLRMRGMPARHTQVLMDGLPLLGAEPDAFGLLQTPPLDLARVEVIPGIASALYGGSALGGVLNLVSKRPTGDPMVLANAGSLGETDLVGFVPGRITPRWGYTLTGGAHGQRREDPDGDGWAEVAGYRRAEARPRLFWDDGAGRSLLLTGGYTAENRRGGTLPGRTLPSGPAYAEGLDTRRADAGLAGHALTGGGLLLGGRASVTRQSHRRSYAERVERDRQTTGFAEATLGGSHAGHTWVLGSALEVDALSAPVNRGAEYRYVTPGVFAQDEAVLADWLTVALSARVDHQNRYGTFLSPRVSALVRPGGGLTVRASGGTGWAAPRPLIEEVEAVGLAKLSPVQDLRAESAAGVSLDAGWNAGPLELSASVFGSRVRHPLNERTVRTGPTPMLELYSMAGPRETRGAELLAHVDHGVLQLLASYTYLDAREENPSGGRRWAERVPRKAGEVGAILEDEEVGRVGVEWAYTGKMRIENDPYRGFTRPFSELNFLAAKSFGETQVFFNALNLLDVRQSRYDPLLRPAPSAVGQPATDLWAPLAGRVFNVGVQLEM